MFLTTQHIVIVMIMAGSSHHMFSQQSGFDVVSQDNYFRIMWWFDLCGGYKWRASIWSQCILAPLCFISPCCSHQLHFWLPFAESLVSQTLSSFSHWPWNPFHFCFFLGIETATFIPCSFLNRWISLFILHPVHSVPSLLSSFLIHFCLPPPQIYSSCVFV